MSESKTVKDILIEYLKANGFDGLCGDSCGCGIDELAPFEHCRLMECNPAYKFTAKCSECQGCESWDEDVNPTFCYTTKKPESGTEAVGGI